MLFLRDELYGLLIRLHSEPNIAVLCPPFFQIEPRQSWFQSLVDYILLHIET